jgi:pyruvate formate lyase activating enzyme
MDAANIDLKAFSETFYSKLAAGRLEPVKDTLRYVCNETDVWVELTTLLIPGWNDSEKELHAMTQWVAHELGPEVPMHFTAFHPDWKLRDVPSTPSATLDRAREIAKENGILFAYTGNVHDKAGGSTYCPSCGETLIGRNWYVLSDWNLSEDGACNRCESPVPGVFEAEPGTWGARRLPVRMADFP